MRPERRRGICQTTVSEGVCGEQVAELVGNSRDGDGKNRKQAEAQKNGEERQNCVGPARVRDSRAEFFSEVEGGVEGKLPEESKCQCEEKGECCE